VCFSSTGIVARALLLWAAWVAGFLCSPVLVAAESPVAIVYPEAPEPYRGAFSQIVAGAEQALGERPLHRELISDRTTPPELAERLREAAPALVITLALQATELYAATGLDYPQILGALNSSPQTRPEASGISLSADPALAFATLRQLKENTRRVHVVFDPGRDRWLIDLAQQAAAAAGLTLLTYEASQRREAARHFEQIIDAAAADTDALWLLLNDRLVDRDVVLPAIVQQSWANRFVVFSNHPSHAERGVLFALFPDDFAMGQRLGDMARERLANPQAPPRIEPLRAVRRALNLRVANRLGISVDRATERTFDLIFGRFR
jgi:putative ABC transport system substrate-binding protein